VKKHLKSHWKVHEEHAKGVSLTDIPAYPFSSVAVNLHAKTGVHFDFNDQHICLVMSSGKWKGGQLLFGGVNLILDLAESECVAFDSSAIAHFNMPLTAEEGQSRHTIVLHSDRRLDVKGNGWTDRFRLFKLERKFQERVAQQIENEKKERGKGKGKEKEKETVVEEANDLDES
jgi:hypothetical protein